MGVVLKDSRETKIVELPSYPGSKIEVFGRLTAGEVFDSDGSNLKAVLKAIKSWNFVDESDKPLLVNEENVRMINNDDFMYLLNQITEFANTQKKTEPQHTEGGQ